VGVLETTGGEMCVTFRLRGRKHTSPEEPGGESSSSSLLTLGGGCPEAATALSSLALSATPLGLRPSAVYTTQAAHRERPLHYAGVQELSSDRAGMRERRRGEQGHAPCAGGTAVPPLDALHSCPLPRPPPLLVPPSAPPRHIARWHWSALPAPPRTSRAAAHTTQQRG
jgi:hypothetical protein